jgi:DNA polymerase, archaea type
MAVVRGHLVDLKYSIDKNIIVHLFCRNEIGQIIVIHDYYRPNFYALPKKNVDIIELRTRIARLKFDDHGFVTSTSTQKKSINSKEESFIKVFVSKPDAIKQVRQTIERWDEIISCFEDDISLTRKYMLENKLIPFSIFEAEVIDTGEIEASFRLYKLIRFTKKDIMFAQPETLSLSMSFEDDERGNRSLSAIAYSHEKLNKVVTWKKSSIEVPGMIKVSGEEELLDDFKKTVHDLKPDILLFEDKRIGLNIILERAKKYRQRMNINFDISEPFANPFSKKARTIGINEIFIKSIISNFISFSLVEKDLKKMYSTIDGAVNLASMAAQTEYDQLISILRQKAMINLLLFNSLYINLSELFRLVGLRMSDVLNFSLMTVTEWILVKESMDKDIIVLNKPRNIGNKEARPIHSASDAAERYTPIIDPVPGVYSKIVMIRLNRIYPHMIISSNLSPDTMNCACCTGTCKNTKGLLPTVLLDILSRIKRIDLALSKEKNDNLQRRKNILLRILDYFYEYLNSPYSRWHSKSFLEELNSMAKKEIGQLIKKTSMNNSVVYSDYSELYVSLNEDEQSYEKMLKEMFPDSPWARIEAVYEKGIFLPRDDTRFSKKRFALIDKAGSIFEYNISRQTYPFYVRQVIRELLKAILASRPKDYIADILRKYIGKLAEGKADIGSLVMKTRIAKRIEEYTEKTTQHHLVHALKAKGRAISKGDYIEYIVAALDEPISKRARLPEDMASLKYDAEYYVEKVLLPAVQDIILVKGITIEDIKESKDQSELDRFIR